MLGEYRNDNGRELRSLGFMNGDGIGQGQFVLFSGLAENPAPIDIDRQFPALRKDVGDPADVSVEHFLGVVVSNLHDLIPDSKPAAGRSLGTKKQSESSPRSQMMERLRR